MFEGIHFETEEEKWTWGSIIGGVGLGGIITTTILVCFCRNCLRRRLRERAIKNAYKEREKNTQLCVENKILNPVEPSAPPYGSL